MREGKPSFTAAAVAAARAVAGVDPVALDLLGGPLSWVVRAGRLGRAPAAAINVATFGLVDHLEMRTRAIDLAVGQGVAAGATQLVLLGAGLDARAWRMDGLEHVRVFEVDHPSTQAYKRARTVGRAPRAAGVTFVPVDFGRDALGAALAGAGHDDALPTFWIWEGVTPYLPLAATRATLAAVAERSAAGSRLAVTYVTPEGTPLGGPVARVGLAGFRLVGEAIVGAIAIEAMAGELRAAGFRVLDDASPRTWADRHGQGRPRLLLVSERLAVAVSDAPPRAPRAG